ncbi:hypothetical protein EBU71_21580 [bacterium]|jgi:hypothetical protein|nr:hypothetical protein [Candidatus Elulimicrobium humile]
MNPFEIRAQLLKMSKDYLDRQFDVNTEFTRRAFEEMAKSGQDIMKKYEELAPKMYTFEDVIEQAKKLYGFVNSK